MRKRRKREDSRERRKTAEKETRQQGKREDREDSRERLLFTKLVSSRYV